MSKVAAIENHRRYQSRQKEKGAKLYYFDYSLLLILLLLVAFGMVMLYSVSAYQGTLKWDDPAYYLKKQLYAAVLGFVVLFFLCKAPKNFINALLTRFAGAFYILSLVLCVAVIFLGTSSNNSSRWFKIGGVSFQPSEVAKVAVIVFLALLIQKSRDALRDPGNVLKAFGLVLPVIAVVAYNNLSTAVIIAGIAFVMLFVASPRKKIFFAILGAGAVLGVLFILLQGYRSTRILVWLHPEDYDTGFQTLQGLYAIGSGGLFGKGLGGSLQKLGYVPEAQNDMIFSIICEELGIIGAIGVIILYLLLLWRILFVAVHAKNLFGSFICIGVMTHIALQVVLNIAVVTNTIPNTGIILPFISYGGTSLSIIIAEVGLVLYVSRSIELPEVE